METFSMMRSKSEREEARWFFPGFSSTHPKAKHLRHCPPPRPPAKAAWSLIPQAVVTDNTPPSSVCSRPNFGGRRGGGA